MTRLLGGNRARRGESTSVEVPPSAPVNTVVPTLSMTPTTISGTVGTWTGAVSYVWAVVRVSDLQVVASGTGTAVSASGLYATGNYFLQVTATNAVGDTVAGSVQIAVNPESAPINTVTPALTINSTTFSGNVGSWSGADSYAWSLRDDDDDAIVASGTGTSINGSGSYTGSYYLRVAATNEVDTTTVDSAVRTVGSAVDLTYESLPLTLPSGGTWTGNTPAPSLGSRTLTDHPRLLLTNANRAAMVAKLADPVYDSYRTALAASSDPYYQALQWQLYGTTSARDAAKTALLNNTWGRIFGFDEDHSPETAGAFLYDWLYDSLTTEERVTAQANIEGRIRPDYTQDNLYYWNDNWSRGAAQRVIVALASDSSWAADRRTHAYDDTLSEFGMYAGGAIDVLNTIALTSGGAWQVGNSDNLAQNYEAFFHEGAFSLFPIWQTATGEQVMDMTTYFRQYPYYLAYCGWNMLELDSGTPGVYARMLFEFLTGNAGDSGRLAKWFSDSFGLGPTTYNLPMRMLIGDLRKTAATPEELNLPTAKWNDGASVGVVVTGWDTTDTKYVMTAKHWDSCRYGIDSGCLAIYKNGLPVLTFGTEFKGVGQQFQNSAIWVWDDIASPTAKDEQANVYARKLVGWADRPNNAVEFFDHANTQPETLDSFTEDDGVYSMQTTFQGQLQSLGNTLVRRKWDVNLSGSTQTIDSVSVPNGAVLVTDTVTLISGKKAAMSWRLSEEPTITDGVIETSKVRVTVLTSYDRIYWDGGALNENSVPWDSVVSPASTSAVGTESVRVNGAYYTNATYVRRRGLGNAFVHPVDGTDASMQFLVEVL